MPAIGTWFIGGKMTNIRRAVAAAIVMLATVLAGPQVAPAQTLSPPAETPAAFSNGHVLMIKLALRLDEAQLKRWAPLEAQLHAAIVARQKVRGGAFWPFLASLSDRQKEIAGVLLRPVVDESWPSPVYTLKEERDFKGHYRALLRGTTLLSAKPVRPGHHLAADDPGRREGPLRHRRGGCRRHRLLQAGG
jgi:hypothetical protein